MKFDWIDFGLGDVEKGAYPDFDLARHRSTTSLIAGYLRRREFPCSKIFLWLRNEDVFLVKDSLRVRQIEARFPFADFLEMPENARLAFFGEWVIHSVSRGATELGITDSERIGLLERLVADRFTYVRTDKVRGDKGATMRCTARFEHSPTTVVLTVLCRGMDGSEHSRVVEGAFRRDELDYGSSVESITLSDHGEMMIKTYKGWI